MKRTIQMAKSSVRLFVKVRLFIGCVDQVKRNYNCPGMAPPPPSAPSMTVGLFGEIISRSQRKMLLLLLNSTTTILE